MIIIARLGQITCITLYDIIALIITGLWLIAGYIIIIIIVIIIIIIILVKFIPTAEAKEGLISEKQPKRVSPLFLITFILCQHFRMWFCNFPLFYSRLSVAL